MEIHKHYIYCKISKNNDKKDYFLRPFDGIYDGDEGADKY